MDYTKSAPITGYGKLKCVSEVDRKSVSTQCEPQQTCTEQTCTPQNFTEQTCTEQTCTPQSELVISKLESVTSALNDMFGKKQEDVKFVILPNNKVKCNSCEKVLLKTNFKKHTSICRQAPKNVCRFCKTYFNTPSVLSRHQKTCKKNPLKTNKL